MPSDDLNAINQLLDLATRDYEENVRRAQALNTAVRDYEGHIRILHALRDQIQSRQNVTEPAGTLAVDAAAIERRLQELTRQQVEHNEAVLDGMGRAQSNVTPMPTGAERLHRASSAGGPARMAEPNPLG